MTIRVSVGSMGVRGFRARALAAVLALGATALVGAYVLATPSHAQTPTLNANVGPGFTISLTDAAGNPVTNLRAGTYTINVTDQSAEHNFHLIGPGLDAATGVPFVGTVAWTVTFLGGRYVYQCDPHATTMRGSFTSVVRAAVTGVHVQIRRRGGFRELAIRVRAEKPVRARMQLLRGSRAVATAARSLGVGSTLTRLRVPRSAPAGRYVVDMRFADPTGPDVVSRRTIRLPRR